MILKWINSVLIAKNCNHQTFKYIKELQNLEKQEFLSSFDFVFCDCDGVIWRALGEGIPGVGRAINFLRNQGKTVAFVTNNSIMPIELQLQKFQSCSIDVKKQDVIHPAQTVCNYLKAKKFDGLIYCLASTPFKNLLNDAGFQLAETQENAIPETVHALSEAIFKEEPVKAVKAVVIDVDFNLNAIKLMRAHQHLKDPECLFIAGAADEKVPFGEGKEIIGSGPFIDVVEKVTKRKATILGKPGMELGEILKKRFDLHKNPRRVLFIGDGLCSDVRFAKMNGFQTLLVLSGGTKASELHMPRPSDEVPDYVALSLSDFNEF